MKQYNYQTKTKFTLTQLRFVGEMDTNEEESKINIERKEKKTSEMSVGFEFDGELEKATVAAWLTVGDGRRLYCNG